MLISRGRNKVFLFDQSVLLLMQILLQFTYCNLGFWWCIKASINWSSVIRKCALVKKPSAWSLFIDYFSHESNLFQFIKIKMKMRKNSFQYLENFYEWMKEMLSDKKNMKLNENSGIKRIHVIFLIYCTLVIIFSFKLIYQFTFCIVETPA